MEGDGAQIRHRSDRRREWKGLEAVCSVIGRRRCWMDDGLFHDETATDVNKLDLNRSAVSIRLASI